MDFAFSMLVASSILDIATAVKCHDCSSWNPYCREKVDEPFESAVAAVECEKTNTCFLKKDETGVINRGCADWWMESQVDMNYIGCQTQHVPWLGEMVWCFCKEDYCNGGSIDMMANKVYPQVKDFPKDNWGDYGEWEEDWADVSENQVQGKKKEKEKDKEWGDTGRKWGKEESEKEEDKETVTETGAPKEKGSSDRKRGRGSEKEVDSKKKEMEKARTIAERKWGKGSEEEVDEKETKADEGLDDSVQMWPAWGKGKTFDDLNPGYLGTDKRKMSDPKYRLWFWHADSDRPHWEKEEEGEGAIGWRAPEWVEEEDGKGWDFPVTGNVHEHTAEETTEYHDYSDYTDTATAGEDKTTTTETWDWGDGWGHIKPWWLREDEDDETTARPKMWTPHPTQSPKQPQQNSQQRQQQDDGFFGKPSKWNDDGGWGDNSLDHGGVDVIIAKNDVIHNVAKQEFFCWDCYSDSPLCGESVQIQKANYLGKTSCSTTNKCFVRKDNGVIYRGCADGWTSSIIDTNYVGCRVQQMWNREVEWCFCTASLCNGDSMSQIIDKYEAQLEPFKASTPAPLSNMTGNATHATTPAAPASPLNATTTDPKKPAAAAAAASTKGKTTPKHLVKRSTMSGSSNTTDFHIGNETSDSTSASPPGSWQTSEAGSDVTQSGNDVNGTNYRALYG